MSPPVLSRQLTLERASRAPDGAGGFVETWELAGTLWAEIASARGRQRAGAGGPVSVLPMRIVVRGAPVGSARRPAPGARFREGDRVYAIRAVTELDRVGRYLACLAEEEIAT